MIIKALKLDDVQSVYVVVEKSWRDDIRNIVGVYKTEKDAEDATREIDLKGGIGDYLMFDLE
jgi:hypothetical protein